MSLYPFLERVFESFSRRRPLKRNDNNCHPSHAIIPQVNLPEIKLYTDSNHTDTCYLYLLYNIQRFRTIMSNSNDLSRHDCWQNGWQKWFSIKIHSFIEIILNMSLIGKQVIHKNFQSESFYFFWFPGAPIVLILVSNSTFIWSYWPTQRRNSLGPNK